MLISDIPVMSAHHHPERIAIQYQDRAITFLEMERWPGVGFNTVIGLPDEMWGEQVVAVVQARSGSSVSHDELIAFCRERLASYKKPRQIVFAGELPKNASGKILKRELRDRLRSKPFPAAI